MSTAASRAACILASAAGYAALGWPCFILSPSKVPVANCDRCRAEHVTPAQMESCRCLTCHGFYSSTTDLDRIGAMARRSPRGLLAVRAGAPSGLVIVDIDAPVGLVTMRTLIAEQLLPRTVCQRTGGGGYHMLYGHPGVRIPSVPGGAGDHVDIKADGGYFVAEPSVHPVTREPYRWLAPFSGPLAPLPQAWVDRLTAPPAREAPSRPVTSLARPGAYGAAVLEREIAAASSAPGGSRNYVLNKTAFALFRHVAAGTLGQDTVTAALWDAAAATGLAAEDPAGVRRTIASAKRAGSASPRERGQRVA